MKIAEVSKEYGLSVDTLRYYERIGLLPNVTRTASGIRDYSEQDCARVQFVKRDPQSPALHAKKAAPKGRFCSFMRSKL